MRQAGLFGLPDHLRRRCGSQFGAASRARLRRPSQHPSDACPAPARPQDGAVWEFADTRFWGFELSPGPVRATLTGFTNP